MVSCWLFFFFQAEDGIRDVAVTGVQTCALPIYRPARNDRREVEGDEEGGVAGDDPECRRLSRRPVFPRGHVAGRSEERRVGKECRFWWGRYHEKKIIVREGAGLLNDCVSLR